MEAERLPTSPIITGASHPSLTEHEHTNINGPSLIRVPEFVTGALGRYYLYFAHHQGTFIRLAYADDPAGPWTVHAPGTLRLDQCPPLRRHVASPDVHIDADNRRLVMYAHGPAATPHPDFGQLTAMFTSTDGLNWTCRTEPITGPYLRVFRHGGMFYGLSMPWGTTWRASTWEGPFERGPLLWGEPQDDGPKMRHAALLVRGDTLHVVYSRIGDQPEHLVHSTVDLAKPFEQWRGSEPASLLRPEHDWEGVQQPIERSVSGARHEPVHQLRDPALFDDPDTGRTYLVYSTAGEQGLAVAGVRLEA